MCVRGHRYVNLTVGLGIEVVVSKSVHPIRTVESKKQADQGSGRPTDSRTLSD
jgi:hypothetical protein